MRKFLSLILALIMVMSLTVSAFAADFKDTTDIPQSDAIDVISTLGVVEGYGNNTYGPNDELTRAQLCTMLTRALYGTPIYTSSTIFTDVPEKHWASAYINTAYAYGLMVGYGHNMFGPEDKITYTQMAAVILKALGYDCSKMSWPTGVNSMAQTLNLFKNVSFKDFSDPCTRANAAQIIYNAFNLNYVNHKADYPVAIKGTSFLKDGLGFEETVKTVKGHQYVAYTNLSDGKVFVTDICLTHETVIIPVDGYNYHFKNSSKSYPIDWYWLTKDSVVTLYVNGVEITSGSETLFANCDSAIGIFNQKNQLLAIYIESAGIDYIYQIIPNQAIYDIVKTDKNWNAETSTVTYFPETSDYVISNKITYGWVTGAYKSAIYVNDTKISLDGVTIRGEYNKDSYVKIFYNYRNEIVAIDVIENPYRYDVTDKVYHTVDCDHVTDNKTCDIRTYDQLDVGEYLFKSCPYCHTSDNVRITISNISD